MSIEELQNIAFKRGQVYIADLGSDVVGSEQGGKRPVLILQNNIGNRNSPNLICLAITSKTGKKKMPTHVHINREDYEELPLDSVVLAEQIKTISKQRIVERTPLTMLRRSEMKEVEERVKLSLAIDWS